MKKDQQGLFIYPAKAVPLHRISKKTLFLWMQEAAENPQQSRHKLNKQKTQMKKIKLLAIILFAGMALAACNSTDRQISQYEKACQKGDEEKAEKLAEELSKAELTTEQQARVATATLQLLTTIKD